MAWATIVRSVHAPFGPPALGVAETKAGANGWRLERWRGQSRCGQQRRRTLGARKAGRRKAESLRRGYLSGVEPQTLKPFKNEKCLTADRYFVRLAFHPVARPPSTGRALFPEADADPQRSRGAEVDRPCLIACHNNFVEDVLDAREQRESALNWELGNGIDDERPGQQICL